MHMGAAKTLASQYYAEGQRLSANGRHTEAIGRFEQALAFDPNDTRVLFALGNTARILQMPKPAEAFFRQVLALEPDRLEALVNLANLLRAGGAAEAAKTLLEPALVRNPASPELLLTLGSTHRELGDATKAEEFYRAALQERADYPEALGNLADLVSDAGDTDEALELYDRAIKRDGTNAQARLNRAILHLLKGNLKDGWRDYAARLKIAGKVPTPDHNLPRWSGEPLKKKRLLVTAEQGIGDQIMFASMFGDLAARAANEGASVIVECEPRLVSLLSRSFPSIRFHAAEMETKAGVTRAKQGWLKSLGGANLAIEMGSLAKILRSDRANFPNPNGYLIPDQEEASHWSAEGTRIGICWRSGKTGGLRSLQYASLKDWATFIKQLPGTIVSAQYDATPDETAQLQTLSGREIVVPPNLDQKNEIDRTAAMLSTLDCIVSAPTAVSWLAAGTGVPTLKILFDTSWTSFGETYEPFGPSCLCIGQETRGDWSSAFAKATREISSLLSA